MKPETEEWLEKADGDWRVARRELQAGNPVFDAVCFHAQQTAEKLIKGWLVEQGIPFGRTHDLVTLAMAMAPGLPAMAPLMPDLARLTAYSTAFRYPGVTATMVEARAAVRIAGDVRRGILPALGVQP